MSESQYAVVFGTVQQFKDKPVLATREVSGQTLREFTIKSVTSGKLVRVSVWPEHAEFKVVKGQGVVIDGKASSNESNGTTFYNISATDVTLLPVPLGKAGREVVNGDSPGF